MRVPRGAGLLIFVVMVSQGEVKVGIGPWAYFFDVRCLLKECWRDIKNEETMDSFCKPLNLKVCSVVDNVSNVCTKSEDSL